MDEGTSNDWLRHQEDNIFGLLWTWSAFERAKKKGKQWGKHLSHQLRGKAGLAEVKRKITNTCKAALEMSLDDTGFDNDILAIISKVNKRNNWWAGLLQGKAGLFVPAAQLA